MNSIKSFAILTSITASIVTAALPSFALGNRVSVGENCVTSVTTGAGYNKSSSEGSRITTGTDYGSIQSGASTSVDNAGGNKQMTVSETVKFSNSSNFDFSRKETFTGVERYVDIQTGN